MIKKRGQEEMVGFGLIVGIVAVILLFVLVFYLRSDSEEIESYEINSFIDSFLQYTTDCEFRGENLEIKDLILECEGDWICADGRGACSVLNYTLKEVIESSWRVGNATPIKKYELNIKINDEDLIFLEKGDFTRRFKGGYIGFDRRSSSVRIFFRVYY